MALSRRRLLAGSAALATGMAMPELARAQTWNPNNVRVVVPFAAGGSVDALGRMVADGLKQGRSGTFVVENKTGASGSVGAATVAKSPPDGETWLLTFDIHAVLPTLIANLPYDNDKDLVPVTLIGTSPMVFVISAKSPFQNFEQMLAHGKAKGGLNYGSGSAGTLGHLTMTVISERSKVPMTHVNYRGGTPALNDALAGHIDGFIGSSSIVAQHPRPAPRVRSCKRAPCAPTASSGRADRQGAWLHRYRGRLLVGHFRAGRDAASDHQ